MNFIKKLFQKNKNNQIVNNTLQKQYFKSYFDLLNDNYNALNIISDLEEKSQGEYVFDINYISTSFSKLQELIKNLAINLINIGGKKYSPIIDKIDAISSQINNFLQPELKVSKELYTIPFNEINLEMSNFVGNKNANLCEISNYLNLPIPNGFAITIWAYSKILEENKIKDKINYIINSCNLKDYENLIKVSSQIQDLIKDLKIPNDIEDNILNRFENLVQKNPNTLVAIRSSSIAEDSYFSFAGQYSTFLGIKKENLIESYKKVIASKFNPNVIFYLLSHDLKESNILMSVSCVEMVNSRSSGVIYTKDPTNPSNENIIINSIWGQGKLLVDGLITPDSIIFSNKEKKIIKKDITFKEKQILLNPQGGVDLLPVEHEKQNACSISDEEIIALVNYSKKIEEYYKQPQDIEWAIDFNGKIFILQTRPLRVFNSNKDIILPNIPKENIIIKGGICACPGANYGSVFNINTSSDLEKIPENSIIITNNPLPTLIKIIDKVKAIITQTGGVASHFVTIAREYRIPTIVGLKDISELKNNTIVTVDATNTTVYLGEYPELVQALKPEFDFFKDYQIMITLNKMLEFISPLNLLYPNSPHFKIEHCKTFHDIVRFIHQKAIEEMFNSLNTKEILNLNPVPLKSSIPLKLHIIYLDKEIDTKKTKYLTIENLDSLPLQFFWEGILKEGWTLPFTSPNFKGFMSVVGTELTGQRVNKLAEKSYAIVNKEYMLLNLRMGYHYSTIEALASNSVSKNFIKMQFKDGGASIDRRERRVSLLKDILSKIGYDVSSKIDYLECSLLYQNDKDINRNLFLLGRLTMLTKQLDLALDDDDSIEFYKTNILKKLLSLGNGE